MLRTAIYLIVGALVVLLFFRALLRGRIPKYNNISKSDLTRYFAYLFQQALADGGTVHLEAEGYKAAVNITRREHLKKPTTISIKLSSGYVPRQTIADVANRMSSLGYQSNLKFTRARRAVHSLTISLNDTDALTPSAIVDVVSKMFDVMGVRQDSTYSVFVYGPLKPGCLPEDGDVVKRSPGFRAGWVVGFIAGKIWRFMRGE